jgi:hypothetical protein
LVRAAERREWFDEILGAEVRLAFSKADIAWLNKARAKGYAALQLTRQAQFGAAKRTLAELGQAIELAPSRPTRLLAEAFAFAQEAYFLYAHGRHTEAIALLQQAFLNDLALEANPALRTLVMHRVQLLHNVMRVDIRRRSWRTAVRFGHALLSYLEQPGCGQLMRLPAPWDRMWPDTLAAFPAEFVAEMHGQIARDQIKAVSHLSTGDGRADEFLEDLTGRDGNTQVGLWMRAKAGLASGGFDDGALADLLARGPNPSLPIWREALMAVRSRLFALDDEDARAALS